MYLKRLDLHGFKSFAPRTAFEFGPGVTAIVGPNGSGKTNVAEAIRWVLGEQASRIIRARKTEDVIFSGSAQRSPLGMAEASLTLDNGDGWLPVDFTEVVVTRRAYRSGENEYYLNQSQIRLKDVTELFLKAQVGQNSYAFMGQGLVEAVLTLRPEERRGLIEEAADVRLHRAKLEEARDRLAATRENLKQVSLLVAEIEPRLRQLERQADRAAAHSRLSTELAQALQAWFGHQWQEAQEALAAARAACDQRQEACERARREAQACEEGLAALTAAIEERRRDIAGREEAYRALEEERRDLQRRVTLDEERHAMLATRQEELRAELVALKEERERLAGLETDQRQQGQALKQAHDEAQQALAASEQELEHLDTRLARLRRALGQAEGEAASAKADLVQAEAHHRALSREQERLVQERDALQRTRTELLQSLRSWAQEMAGLQQPASELAPQAEQAQEALADSEARASESAQAIAQLQEERRLLAVQIESAQARLELVAGLPAEPPTPDAGIRAVLAAGGRVPDQEPPPDERIHGVIGLVGQVLRVPAGLERAIEAALADSLHAVIVQSQEDALAAVELLISEDRGRATIYPLDSVQPRPPLNLLEERGVMGVASQLVRCDGRYRPLIDALLGRTIVVENLGIAQMVRRRGLGSVVTLDGVLLRPLGSLTAGSARPVRQSFVRQREQGELPRELARLRAAQGEATAALEEQQRQRDEALRAYEQQAAALERLRRELAGAEEALARHRGRLPALASQLSALHARRADIEQALAAVAPDLKTAGRDLERQRRRAEAAAARAQDARQEREQVEAARGDLAARVAASATQAAGQEAELRALAQLQESQSASLARIERELAQKEALAARLEDELAALDARLEAARQGLEERSREAETAREELEPARQELAQLESRQRTLNEELAAARARSLAAERALLDAEADVRLRSEELDALRSRLEEDGFQTSPEGAVLPAEGVEGPPDWLSVRSEQGASPEEPLPPMRGGAQIDPVALKERIVELRSEIRSLGPVNEQAQADYAESRQRYDYLTSQLRDLEEAEASLQEAIQELERIIKGRFSATFQQVNREFQRYFEVFFGGGHAELVLTHADGHSRDGDGRRERSLPGVDIVAQPPRKRVRTLTMLSGGERSLTALALLFALLQTHPSPICVLDEVDAALDDANIGRFCSALRELAQRPDGRPSGRTQFIIITHNRGTIEMADTIYGVSMGEDSTSSVLSLRLSDLPAS